MNNNLLESKTAEIYQIYSLEKYPNSLGVYRIQEDGSIRIGYIYKNEQGFWVNNLNDKIFYEFKPDEIVYSCFDEGYTPFYISDYVHAECWDKTSLTYNDKDDIYYEKRYHGQKAYFDYCRNNGINEEYMKNLTGRHHFGRDDADQLFWENDKLLQSQIADVLKENQNLEPITLQSYEYMLNEPFYENITPLYTLDCDGDKITLFGYDDFNSIVSIRNDHLPYIFDYQDWAYNTQDDFYKKLDQGASIVYISTDTHENLLYELAMLEKSEFDKQTISGIKKYLAYINDNLIRPTLSKDNQKNYKKLIVDYKLDKIQKQQSHIKNKQEMER